MKRLIIQFTCSYLFITSLLTAQLFAQPVYDFYSTHGQAGPVTINPCNQITLNQNVQVGTAWINYALSNDSTLLLDLSATNTLVFDQTFEMYFGSNNWSGADGMAFVIRDITSSAMGGSGHGIGYGSGFDCTAATGNCFIEKSIAIEFDTHINIPEAGDPAADHIAIQTNGVEDHRIAANSKIMHVLSYDVEDGMVHDMRIRISPVGSGDYSFEIFFDNLTTSLVNYTFTSTEIASIFPDPSQIVWGMTGATGGLNALQLFGQSQYCSQFLPVEMLSFEAEFEAPHQVTLEWVTATELNNDMFQLMRKSGEKWQVLATIDGKGTTENATLYSFADEKPRNGINTYRLRQIDFDGTIHYSRAIEINVPLDLGLEVFPNPSHGQLTVRVSGSAFTDKALILNILDLRGRLLIQQNMDLIAADYQELKVNTDNLLPGMYIVNILNKKLRQLGADKIVVGK